MPPEQYRFELGKDARRLVLDDTDGSVWVFGESKEPIGHFETPWAFDANGVVVPTHYEVSGKTLTQVVKHQAGDYKYGITADPKWSKKWITKFKKLFKACLGLTLGTEALLQLVSSPNKAAKFMIRRLGLFGAIWCGGGIIKKSPQVHWERPLWSVLLEFVGHEGFGIAAYVIRVGVPEPQFL